MINRDLSTAVSGSFTPEPNYEPGTIALLTLAVTAGTAGIGLKQQADAADDAKAASAKIAKQQDEIEKQKKTQAGLELARQRRKSRRLAIIEQSRIRNAAVTRGIGLGGSSVAGATGAAQTEFGFQIGAIGQNEQLGEAVFGANAQIGQARDQFNQAGANAAFGRSVQGIGGAIARNVDTFQRVGNNLSNTLFPQSPTFTTTVRQAP